MSATYLSTSYRDREQVKALGARWDPEQKKWYVPSGRDLAPFAPWLPSRPDPGEPRPSPLPATTGTGGTVTVPTKGIPLSSLLTGVTQAIAQAFRAGVWTTVEVLKADVRRGHVYLELAERDAQSAAVAQARAMIWSDTANRIIPVFERATGVVLGAGIKLLVCAKPTMHPLYGLSLVIDAIDSDYTLGDLEARKREIRARLQREGLFDRNRALPTPWDYRAVLVVAPEGAAGLGDFRAEADRLQRYGICHFVYAYSRFQGEDAATEILAALSHALQDCRAHGGLPDAVVIIRGGGAVNDLAWLNDYDLARAVCELEVPVLTGIGHERDSTVIDEVAHQSFDTPSKVIAGMEQVIVKRVRDAQAHFAEIVRVARQSILTSRRATEQADATVRQQAQRQFATARQAAADRMAAVRVGALQSIRNASQATRETFLDVRHQAAEQIASARQQVPALAAEIRSEARQTLREARAESGNRIGSVLERAGLDATRARAAATRELSDLHLHARRLVDEARTQSQALLREIAGQGPDKSLGRGFAIVRSGGSTVTSATGAPPGAVLDIQFHDGRMAARTQDPKDIDTP